MNNSKETRIQINDKKTKETWELQSTMDKDQKSIGHKSGAIKNDRFEEEMFSSMCNQQLDDSY